MIKYILTFLIIFAGVWVGIQYGKYSAEERVYDRTEFGPTWYDADGNGCDTRNDILMQQIKDPIVNSHCKVIAGTVVNKYTNETSSFVPGPLFPIDHIVSLKDAWESGADTWSAQDRLRFANDPDNLLVTDQKTNTNKSDKGPDKWLPKSNVCEYVLQYIEVKDKYGLTYTASQDKAIQETECIK